MRLHTAVRGIARRLSLTQQVALMSLIPIVALGFVLARVLQAQIDARSLADASRSIALIAKIGIQPRLSAHALHYGLSAAAVKSLDSQLNTRSTSSSLVRLKIWNMQDRAIYSDDHSLIGHTYPPSSELRSALAGSPQPARILTPSPHGENASEVGLGQLVEAYVPLRFSSTGPPAGAFEMYFSYSPIAAEVSREKRTIAMLVAIGLALLWAAVYRIVSRASRRLRRQAEENDRLARYDQLTGLPNRTLFLERLARAAHRDGPRAGAPAILVMDLDGFRQINNTLGNQMGDRVLCEVAERLREELGADTLIARLGPDEFGILCPRSEGADGALDTARRVQTSLEAPIALDAVALNLEASIGVAVLDERAGDLDTLLQRADIALSRARGHLSRVEVYSREHDSFDASRLILLGQVRAALERDEFVLHYQPKLSLTLGRITAVEALVRWRHPEHGLLAPLEFIPLIEQTALVRPVTLHVVDCALRDMVAWRRRGIHLHMSVNLSARNLLDPELPSQILERLRRNGVPAQHLTLEVTESATMVDPERAIRVLDALRGSGIGVSIDDFGTGNASIDYLARLPANEIKIDRKFVAAVCDDARADAIVRSTVDFARHLSLRVVAEGVETEAILERITALGCDEAQGYLVARPLTAEQLITHLGAERREAPARRRRRAAGALAGSRSRV